MSREWKPGAVALVKTDLHGEMVAFRCGTAVNPGWQYVTADGRVSSWSADSSGYVEPIRPLVVIDPESERDLDRLQDALITVGRRIGQGTLQAALREFANPTPPKPDEPTGLGAVVAAKCGCQPDDEVRFVRDPDARDFNLPWDAKNVATGAEVPWVSRCGHHRYTDVAAVRVLSEGVTA